MKKILVTGATGFVGTRLIECLSKSAAADGAHIFALTRTPEPSLLTLPHVSVLVGDLTHMPLPDVDQVYHLAGVFASKHVSASDPLEIIFNNIEMTKRLLEKYAHTKTKIVFASTIEVNYFYANSPYKNRSAYAYSKLVCEKLLDFSELDHATVRLPHLYGPGMTHDTVVRSLIQRALTLPESLEVKHSQDTRVFLHVDDAVNGLILAMKELRESNGTLPSYYFSLGNDPVSIRHLASLIGEYTHTPFTFPEEKESPEDRKVDWKYTQSALQWSPQISLEDGLQKTIEWYRENL